MQTRTAGVNGVMRLVSNNLMPVKTARRAGFRLMDTVLHSNNLPCVMVWLPPSIRGVWHRAVNSNLLPHHPGNTKHINLRRPAFTQGLGAFIDRRARCINIIDQNDILALNFSA